MNIHWLWYSYGHRAKFFLMSNDELTLSFSQSLQNAASMKNLIMSLQVKVCVSEHCDHAKLHVVGVDYVIAAVHV